MGTIQSIALASTSALGLSDCTPYCVPDTIMAAVPLRGFMESIGALDDLVGLDTVNTGPIRTYRDAGYPWQSRGDRPHSFQAVKRDGVV